MLKHIEIGSHIEFWNPARHTASAMAVLVWCASRSVNIIRVARSGFPVVRVPDQMIRFQD